MTSTALKVSTVTRSMTGARRGLSVRCEAMTPVKRVQQAGVALLGAAMLVTAAPAFADDAELLEIGQGVFIGNCAACHTGGLNTVEEEKTLKKGALELYLAGGFNEKAITTQVINGKNSMPAWGDRLDDDEIKGVAKYVFKQASENLWE